MVDFDAQSRSDTDAAHRESEPRFRIRYCNCPPVAAGAFQKNETSLTGDRKINLALRKVLESTLVRRIINGIHFCSLMTDLASTRVGHFFDFRSRPGSALREIMIGVTIPPLSSCTR